MGVLSWRAMGVGVVDPEVVQGWDISALKKFLKSRGLNVKHYKERELLLQDVLGVIETEAFDAQLWQGLVVAAYLVAAFLVVRLVRRYRGALHVALHINPLWIAYWALDRVLAFMAFMNLLSVLCSWVLPARWNLAKVYFWDYLLPDFGCVDWSHAARVRDCACPIVCTALLRCGRRQLPVPSNEYGQG